MNRFVVAGAVVGLCLSACGKAPETGGRDADTTAPTDSQRIAAAASPLPDSNGNRETATAPPPKPAAEGPSDVTGAFFATDKLPGAFDEIDFLGLATIDDQGKPSPLNGFLRPKRKSAKDYHLVDPKLTGADLAFTTEAIAGVSYAFAGTFVQTGNFPENPPTDVVLKGTLTKMKDGAKVAETPVSFTYSAGG